MHHLRWPSRTCTIHSLLPDRPDKCPGVWPIGVGKTSRKIVRRPSLPQSCMLDVQEAAGSLQLCAGQQASSEAAVHTMCHISNDPNSQVVLLVDTTNAFNSLNCQTALLNIHSLCPPLATVLTNTYRSEKALSNGIHWPGNVCHRHSPLHPATQPTASHTSMVCRRCNSRWSHPPSTWMMNAIAYLQAILWLLRQPSQDMAHRERTPTLPKMISASTCVNVTTHRKCYLGATLGSMSFVEKLCTVQGQPVGWHSEEAVLYCPHSATCCLLHPIPIDLPANEATWCAPSETSLTC